MTERQHERASAGGPRERGCQQEHATGDSGSAQSDASLAARKPKFAGLLARSVSMTESSLDPDRLGPTADPLSSLDPATARIAAMDAALPSWHLGPFWAAVALLALVLILAVLVWPLRRRIANSRVLRQFSAVRRVSSDPSIVRQPHLLPSVSAQSARDHPLCLPRSLHPAHIDSNAHTRVRVHTTTTATRTHTHTASLSLSFSAGLFPVHTAPSLARARTSSRG